MGCTPGQTRHDLRQRHSLAAVSLAPSGQSYTNGELSARRNDDRGTANTMEWPMQQSIRPRLVLHPVTSLYSKIGKLARRIEFERLCLFLLLWRIKPLQPPSRS